MDGIVKLERRALGGFGFSVIGGVDTHLPPMICAVVQNGSAHLSGRVTAGDVILEVNGKAITDLTTSQVVECIKDSPDELSLRLMQDSGAKERAKPYLRTFTIADPKIPLYQAKLHRTASAPIKPRKRSTEKKEKPSGQRSTEIVRRKTTTSKDHEKPRVVGQKDLLGMEQGADGIYKPKHETPHEPYRVMTYFPVDGKAPKTIENYSSQKSNEISQRRSFPERDSLTSSTSLSPNSSALSLPKNCPSCGGGMLVSSTPGLHGAGSKSGSIPTALKCRKCGKNMRVTVSNSSLPEKTVDTNHRTPHLKPSTSLPPNVHFSNQHNNARTLTVNHESHLLKASSSGTLTGSDSHLDQDKAREFAIKLYRLNGYTKDEVAPELSKNTAFSKAVAKEYLKLFDFSHMTVMLALREFIKHVLLIGETQERERILIPFSERYYNCNKPEYGSADAIHTLICAILLLNTDLHGEKITKKMTCSEFNDNLAGLCDNGDFPKELLKSVYQDIKQAPLEWSGEKPPGSAPGTPKASRSANGIRAVPGNPFLEIQCDENDKVYKDGLLYRKVTMESEGKKTSAWKRKWLPFYATLKGLILFLHKSDEVSALENNRNCLGIHHSFATRATDYRKRQFVFRLVTADWREFLFQAKDQPDMKEWIDIINLVAATFSSPPLAAPVGSSKRFQRPVLPFSKTRLTLTKQIEHHEKKAKESQDDLIACLQTQPRTSSSRDLQEWQEKRDFLEYEYKRYMSYVTSLRESKLEAKMREKSKSEARSAESIILQLKRSSSMGNVDTMPGYRPRNLRDSYFMAIYQSQ